MKSSIPNEILLHIFSFLGNKANIISPLSRVCKTWQNVANKDELWQQLIRPEYLDKYQTCGSSAKEFYKKNIDARIDTYYLIGSPVKTADRNWEGTPRNTSISNNTLFNAFPKNEKIKIFSSRNDAIKYADMVCDADITAMSSSMVYIYNYTPIFTVQINDMNLIVPSQLNLQQTFSNYGLEDNNHYPCFEVPSSQVNKIYSLFYKTGILHSTEDKHPSKEKHHELILNQQMNHKNQNNQKSAQQHNKCSIQ